MQILMVKTILFLKQAQMTQLNLEPAAGDAAQSQSSDVDNNSVCCISWK